MNELESLNKSISLSDSVELTLSLASMDDLQEVMSVYRSLLDPEDKAWGWNEFYPDEENAIGDISRRELYTLRDDTRIVAVASMCALNELEPLEWTPKNPCELSRLAVIPDMQGRGIAKLMIRELTSLAKRDGFDGMILLVTLTHTAAFALYEKCGFVRCGKTFMWDRDFYCYELLFD